jgi:CBS domain-containing protein
MNVERLMTRQVHFCSDGDSLNRAAQLMWEADCGFLPVVDDRRQVIGVVTDRDLLMGAYTQGCPLSAAIVATVMNRDVWTCRANEDVSSVEKRMQQHQIRRVPVVNEANELAGVISMGDLARSSHSSALKQALSGLTLSDTLAAICEPRPRVASHPTAHAAE